MYCEKCSRIVEGNCCPSCKGRRLREPEPNDPCFLDEEGYVSSSILEDILAQNGIHFLKKSVLGAGIAIRVGPVLDRFRYYVPYIQLEEARKAVEGLFDGTRED